MQGLNVLVNVIARPQSADDAVGGSVRTDAARYANVRARIANKMQPLLLTSQGFEGKELHQIILWPDNYPDIEQGDIVVPQSGRWTGGRFKVIEVQPSSVLPGQPRAHIQLMTERIRYADNNVPEV